MIQNLIGKFRHIFARLSRNTQEEIAYVMRTAFVWDIERVILVSDPGHSVRYLRDAHAFFASNPPRFNELARNLEVRSSHIASIDPRKIAIAEPAHRPGLPDNPLRALMLDSFTLRGDRDRYPRMLAELRAVIGRYQADLPPAHTGSPLPLGARTTAH